MAASEGSDSDANVKVRDDEYTATDDMLTEATGLGMEYPPPWGKDPMGKYFDRLPHRKECPTCKEPVLSHGVRGLHYCVNLCKNGHYWWSWSPKLVDPADSWATGRTYGNSKGAFKRVLGPVEYRAYILEVVTTWVEKTQTGLDKLKESLKKESAAASAAV